MKERVLYVGLPNGVKYQGVKVTDDGRIGIVYTEPPATKPEPLIGGTDVYHKENGTDYWYCKIKGDRDEFMFLPFWDITPSDLLYYPDGKERGFMTDEMVRFKNNALSAIATKPKKGFCWIPVYEPSMEHGCIQFVPGKDVLRGLDSHQWLRLLNDYSPKNKSRVASRRTYFLLLMRWLKDGIATADEIAMFSSSLGHYCNSANAKKTIEKTGEREFGGLCGFGGNTYKLVWDQESKTNFSLLGGCYHEYGFSSPLAHVYHMDDWDTQYNTRENVGLLELG